MKALQKCEAFLVYNVWALSQILNNEGLTPKGKPPGRKSVVTSEFIQKKRNLATDLAERMKLNLTVREQLNLSYDAHFNLVSIHPFYGTLSLRTFGIA